MGRVVVENDDGIRRVLDPGGPVAAKVLKKRLDIHDVGLINNLELHERKVFTDGPNYGT